MATTQTRPTGTVQPAAPRAAAITSWSEILRNNNTSKPAVTAQARRRISRLRIEVRATTAAHRRERSGAVQAVPVAPQIGERGGRTGIVVAVGEAKEDRVADVRAQVGGGAVRQRVVRQQDVARPNDQLARRGHRQRRKTTQQLVGAVGEEVRL